MQDTYPNGSAHLFQSGSHDEPLATSPLLIWRRIPFLSQLEDMLRSFSPFERAMLYFFSLLLVGSTAFMLAAINAETMVEVPAQGGSLVEGVVGTPRFINPLLAISDTDRDLSMLVYSGLMRAMPDGTIIPDLADHYTISDDGLTYTFTLRDDVAFHDGTPITATDVAFTVSSAQTPEIKSTKRASWEGVEAHVLDEHTVQFVLPRPYAPFLENTTLGILPEHLWANITPEEFSFHPLNSNPIGSGPYHITKIRTDSLGAPTRYELDAFKNFTLSEPYLNEIDFRFYPNEDALVEGLFSREVDSAAGITPAQFTDKHPSQKIIQTTLPRVFAVFLNQNQTPVFAKQAVREALDEAIDKQALINTVLAGYGQALSDPLPPGVLTSAPTTFYDTSLTSEAHIERARAILQNAGWTLDEETGVWENGGTKLAFSLATADAPELVATAEAVADAWRLVGADVRIEVFGTSDLNTGVIRPREYQALLFGEIVGRTLDLFAFWHSSQRTDPGLNLALYTNAHADTLLAEARVETDREVRERKYTAFAKVIREDIPAIFLYAPDFTYLVPNDLEGVTLGALTIPAERFANVYEWHRETGRVWSIFVD